MAPAPPAWADAWLRLLLPARDRDTVSGDLMEEYRENIRPRRPRVVADLWYLRQVSRFAWRIPLWALALSTIYVWRTAYDWFVPATNFAPRAEVTTLTMISTLIVIGASSTLRTRSMKAGIVTTACALVVSSVISALTLGTIYMMWRSPQLLTAVQNSGGLGEAFTMPVILILPGTILGAVGASIAYLRTGTRLDGA